jgi:sulfate transport system ATP-binding protein
MSLEVAGITRRFGPASALEGIDLSVRGGEFVALLGPSGSGKTTLLRILAGLEFPDSGSVRIDGQDMSSVPARARGIGFVFQNYALFRHMTVFDNVAFGLRVRPRARRPGNAEIATRVRRMLELVQVGELETRFPDQLSGGQKQRVALARALATEPPLLLLDEPFGALDAEVRKTLRRWLRSLHQELRITSLFVTHDQEEAMELADRVAVMQAGRVSQFDTPDVLLERPGNAFVAGFLGEALRLPAEARGGLLHFPGLDLAPLSLDRLTVAPRREGPAVAFVRPHEWSAQPARNGTGNARVLTRRGMAGRQRLALELGGLMLEVDLAETSLRPGDMGRVQPLTARAYAAGD